MRLIAIAVVLTLSLILAPLATEAQQAAKSARTGYLLRDNDDPAASSNPREVFLQGLRGLGAGITLPSLSSLAGATAGSYRR